MDCCGAKHMPIFTQSNLNFDHKKGQQKQKRTQFYSFSKKNTDSLLEIFLKDRHDIDALIGSDPNSPDFSLFFETFTVSIDKACKLVIPKITIRNAINNPWITDGIINAVKEKYYFYFNWKKSCFPKVPNGDLILYTKFSDYRRCLKHIVKSVKAKYYNQKITNATGNAKETWEIVNQIRGKAKRSVKPQFVIDNKLVTTRRIIANEFNKYFVFLASKLNDAVIIENLPPRAFDDFMPTSNLGSMFMSECTQYEVSKIISELKNGKSSDILISPILAMHFNYLMSIGKFPNKLKLGKITPIYKKDNEGLLGNYRPVSTLPVFEKIFKKLFMTDYTITLFHREHFMTNSLVFTKITLQVMPSMFLLTILTILKQQSVMETMSLEFLLI